MVSAEHTWETCPHRAEPVNPYDVRITKPNHYYHDSLGCPFECLEDHNHPVAAAE